MDSYFCETHQYLDDNPTATPSDIYTVSAVVTDDDGGVSGTVTPFAPAGGEFRVNTTTLGDQLLAQYGASAGQGVATDAVGNFVVVWTGSDQDGSGVFAQRFNADGTAAGSEFQINTYTTDDQYKPAVAMDGAGNFVVTWSSVGQDGTGSGVYAQRYDAAGNPVGAEFQVNTTTADGQGSPSVAMNAVGNFVITWTSGNQDSDKSSGVFGQLYDSAGNAVGTEFQIHTHTPGTQSLQSVAMDAVGNFVVTWNSSNQDGDDYGIYGQRFDANGNALGSEFQVNTYVTGNQLYPSVAMDGTGNFVITWGSLEQDGGLFSWGVYGQRYAADGTAMGSEFLINSATDHHQNMPSVAMDAVGNFVVTWESHSQDGDRYGVFGQRYNADGSSLGSEFQVNTRTSNEQRHPSVAVDGTGSFVVVWNSYGQEDGSAFPWSWGVYGQRFTGSFGGPGGPDTVDVTVNNVAPTATITGMPVTADEGDVVSLGSSIFDIGTLDTHTFGWSVTKNGAPYVSGSGTTIDFTPDDNGTYDVVLTVTDDDGGVGTATETIEVSNVAPSIAGLAITSPIDENDTATLTGEIVDPGTADSFTLTVDWGDGSPVETFAYTAGTTSFSETHQYLDDGPNPGGVGTHEYTVSVTATDDDGGMSGSPVPFGPADSEFRVNTTTVDSQQIWTGSGGGRAIATDAAGNFVVVWSSGNQDGSSTGIFAQRYDASGNPLGSEFLVNTTTVGEQIDPAVAMHESGSFVITWTGHDGSSFGIFGQRFDVAGNTLGSEFQVNTYTHLYQRLSSVAIDQSGRFVVTWRSDPQDGDGFGVYGQRFAADGAPLGGEFQVNTTTISGQYNPTVAMDNAGGFIIAWSSRFQDGDGWGVFGQRYDSNGIAAGGEFQINTTTASNQFSPSVDVDSSGNFVVAWESYTQDGSGNGVYARRYTAAGSPIGAEFQVNTYTTSNQSSPSVAVYPTGDFVITWGSTGQDGSGVGVFGQRFDPSGSPVGSEFQINTYTSENQSAPSVAIGPAGTFVVVWNSREQDGDTHGVFGQRFIGAFGATGGPDIVDVTVQNVAPTAAITGVPVGAEEGDLISLGSSFSDVGSLDTHTLAWIVTKNGTPFSSGSGSTFQFTPDDNGTYDVELTVTDDDGGIGKATETIEVGNVSPSIANLAISSPINENETATLTGSIVDPGTADSFTVTVDWGDGSPVQTFSYVAGTTSFSETHQYLDDGPNPGGVGTHQYTVSVTATDDDGGRWEASDGDEFAVNAPTRYSQDRPDVVGLSDGGFVVVWHGSRDLGYGDGNLDGVFGQRYDASGLPVGSTFQANTYIQGYQQLASVGALTDGGFVVSWHSRPHSSSSDLGPQDGDGYGVFAQRFDSGGNRVGGEFDVNATTAGDQGRPQVIGLADGGFVITWTGEDLDGDGIFGQQYDASGVAVGGEFRVNTTTAGDQKNQEVTSLSDGGYVVVWDEAGVGEIRGQRYNSSGVAVGGEFTATTSRITPFLAAVTGLADGGFVVGWHGSDGSSYGVYSQRYDSTGAAVGAVIPINSSTNDRQQEIRLAAGEDGGFVAVWDSLHQDGDRLGVFARKFDALGQPLSDDIQVNQHIPESQFQQAIAGLSDGSFAVAWNSWAQASERGYNIYARKLGDATFNGSVSLDVTVNNVAPTATITGAPTTADEGDAISLGSSIFDVGTQDTHTLGWSVTKNGTPYVSGGGATFDFTPDDNGTYAVVLTVTDDDGGVGTATETIEVSNVEPTIANLAVTTPIDENDTVTLTGNIIDPGTADSFTLTLDWGDGSPVQTFTYATGTTSFNETHQYLDDDPTATATDVYNIGITVEDDDTGSNSAAASVTVNNVAPIIQSFNAPVINEDGTATITGSFTDVGTLDTHEVTITWGDGTSSAATVDPLARTFTASHQYLDDDPTATATDVYNIGITVEDDDSTSNSAATIVTVHNVAPTLVLDPVLAIDENGVATLTGTITDPGTLDTFTLDVNWGDALSPDNTEQYTFGASASGTQTFTLTHQYLDDNPTGDPSNVYTINATVTDDDTGTASDAETVTVNNVAPTLVLDPVLAIDENGVATLTGTITDPGTLDTFTLDVNWGDALSPDNTEQYTFGASASGTQTFTLTHQYLDDNPTGDPSNVYTINATVTDDDTGTASDAETVTVNNVAPTLVLDPVLAIDENGVATLTGTITDPGTLDTFTLDVNWGDALSPDNTEQYTFGASASGTQTFTLTHQYLDDNPTGDPSNVYTINATVTDDDTGTASDAETVTVNNVAPTLVLDPVLAIDENGVATLTGTITDPGTLDTFTLDVNWGDALSPDNTEQYTFGASASGTQTFTLTHQYLDDNPTGDPSNVYTINATVTDDDTGTGSDAETVTVNNVAPTVVLDPVLAIDEYGVATLTGTITDPGTLDTFTLDLNWGDVLSPNDTQTFTLGTSALTEAVDGINWDPNTREFSLDHQYLDDNGSGDASNVYTIGVDVTDDDTGTGSTSTTVTVNNEDPVWTSLVNPAEECGHGAEGEPITIDLAFEDVGTLDEHTIVVDWGDGNVETYVLTVGDRAASLSHTYLAGGIYYIDVDLSDDDTGSDGTSTLAVISGANILQVNGEDVLQIIGTDADDHISINQTGNGQLKVHWDFLGDDPRVFPLANVDRIMGMLCDGDDHLTISGKVTLPTIIDAGAGNDHINGGGGSNILLGGDGDDRLNGGSGRDLLIGGMGVDRLVGGPGEDIMTGGVHTTNGSDTLLDNYSSLLATQDRWLGDIDGILSGDQDPLDDAALAAFFASVGDDGGAADKLTGSSSRDWVLLFGGDDWTDQNSKGNGKKKK
ncbi:PKD domain-containing protein [Fuerstiella marisgermanici]|uniref:Cyclolysin n=1 Tax=Fuerstiella marisgermanici TaxID=1891926 RepID=A0A1P8WGR0_9PLAN|nr:PKD domain-containing protein [Fuerstiella marisgermanici]APZ93269.1 Cyclolysin [Fuerstiella marisgermanici]